MSTDRPICVLVAALGGQGGGVLMDWLVAASRIEGFPAQATSTPGVAQRTGATTYYFEVFPEVGLDRRPVFSIYPAPGAVDLQVSFEPTEAARALSGGFVGPETTVITAAERIFSTSEKIRPGDGTIELTPVLEALESCAGKLSIVDLAEGVRTGRCHPNAVMFGAIAASGILPFTVETCRKAIERSGVAVEQNLAGFDAGKALPSMPIAATQNPPALFSAAPADLAEQIRSLPKPVQQMAGHAATHLLDYQDADYAKMFLQRLDRVIACDRKDMNHRLSVSVARRLAAWMAYEDVIRVAQLKTRPGRLSRIRADLAIGDDVPLKVHDFLKPGREELLDLLPSSSRKLKDVPHANRSSAGLALKLKTSGPFGWAVMRLLASLRGWRRRSRRYEREQALIDRWLDAVIRMAGSDYGLACELADLAVWARGYGDVRHRGFGELNRLITDKAGDRPAYADEIRTSLEAAYSESETGFK